MGECPHWRGGLAKGSALRKTEQVVCRCSPGITGATQVSRRQVCVNTENNNKDNDIRDAHS